MWLAANGVKSLYHPNGPTPINVPSSYLCDSPNPYTQVSIPMRKRPGKACTGPLHPRACIILGAPNEADGPLSAVCMNPETDFARACVDMAWSLSRFVFGTLKRDFQPTCQAVADATEARLLADVVSIIPMLQKQDPTISLTIEGSAHEFKSVMSIWLLGFFDMYGV